MWLLKISNLGFNYLGRAAYYTHRARLKQSRIALYAYLKMETTVVSSLGRVTN